MSACVLFGVNCFVFFVLVAKQVHFLPLLRRLLVLIEERQPPSRLLAVSQINPKLCVIAAIAETKPGYSAIARIQRGHKLRRMMGSVSLHFFAFQNVDLAQILAQSRVEPQLILPS
jgi:hypothetical protein